MNDMASKILDGIKKAEEKQKYPEPSLNSEHRKVYRIMSLDDLALARAPAVREGHCVLFEKNNNYGNSSEASPWMIMGGEWNIGHGCDPTHNMTTFRAITEATIFNVMDVIKHKRYINTDWMVGLIDEEALNGEPRQKKYKVEEVINHTLLNLGKIAPCNPTFRAHLNSLFGDVPPLELKTWEEVKDWMEFKPKPRFVETRQAQYKIGEINANRASTIGTLPAREREDDGSVAFEARATSEEAVTGRCHFRIRRRDDNVRHNITSRWLRDMIREGQTMSEMIEQIVRDTRGNCDTNTCDIPGTEEHWDYEDRETESSTINVNRVQVKIELGAWIRREYGTAQAQEILGR